MAKSNLALAARQVSDLKSISAPVGGINARDSLMAMGPDQAISLTNLFPQRMGVQLRLGWSKHAQLTSAAPFETLMNYTNKLGVQTLFGAANGQVYNVTVENGFPQSVLAGLTNNRWQHTQMTNALGSFLVMANGADTVQNWNGTSWDTSDFTYLVPPAVPPALPTPFDSKLLIHVHSVHRRLWFTQKDSTFAYYLPVDLVEGELHRFDVGEIFPRGGYLQCVSSWTVDSATGSDDHVVFISSMGDVAIYTGFDPASADFTLDGVYQIGSTIGRRCAVKYGSDLLILCEDGVLPLTSILAQSKILNPTPLTDMIQLKLSEDVGNFNTKFGWQLVVHNRANQFYINVPDPTANRQYVMNTVTGAWCEFENYNGTCWAIHKDEVFFGTPNGIVAHGWLGTVDAFDYTTRSGGAINGTALCSFSYLGRGAQQKHITMGRVSMISPIAPQYRLGVNVDFRIGDESPPVPPAATTDTLALWGPGSLFAPGIWDQDKWSAASQSFNNWNGIGRIGFCAAPFFKCATQFGLVWISTDLLSEDGQGVL